MTIGQHLEELRKRVLISTFAILAASVVAFVFIDDVMVFIRRPLDAIVGEFPDGKVQLVQFKVFSGFVGAMKIAVFVGAIAAAPITLHQMWSFISAGLYRHERRAVKYYAIPGFGLFLAGAALAYLFVMPYALRFLIGFALDDLGLDQSPLDFNGYVSLIAGSMFAFGMLFQLPIVMIFLMRIGAVEPATFAHYRRHAIVGSFALAMLLTPPDPFTQIALASAMSILYEIAILVGRTIAQPRSTSAPGDE